MRDKGGEGYLNETIELTKISRRKFFKKNAKKLLYSDWLSQIFAFLIVGSCFVGINSFGANLSLLVNSLTSSTKLYGVVYSVYFMLSFFFMIPLLLGLVNFEIDALKNGKGDLKTIFFAFESFDVLLECYRMCISLIGRALLCFSPAIALAVFAEVYYERAIFGFELSLSGIDVVFFVLRSLVVILAYVGFVFFARFVPAVYIRILKPNLTSKQCFMASKVCMFENTAEFVKMVLSFLPLCIASLFSFGLLFVLYTFPYMLITFVLYSKYLYEKEQYNKNASAILYDKES